MIMDHWSNDYGSFYVLYSRLWIGDFDLRSVLKLIFICHLRMFFLLYVDPFLHNPLEYIVVHIWQTVETRNNDVGDHNLQ